MPVFFGGALGAFAMNEVNESISWIDANLIVSLGYLSYTVSIGKFNRITDGSNNTW
jgi:hypothetical protein